MGKYNFDTHINRIGTDCVKWDGMKETYGRGDLLPLWIADMDFQSPQEVVEAIQKRASHGIYGYEKFPDDYHDAFISWQKRRNGWDVDKKWLSHTPGVVVSISACLMSFTSPGDGILIHSPIYHPFKMTIEAMGRKTVDSPLKLQNGKFEFDFQDFEQKAPQARAVILCNPHNPTGRVWTKDELTKFEEICRRHSLLVFSDEIHSDIIFDGHKHIPFATISDWAKNNCVIMMAPSKTFNIAGLATSIIAVPNEKLCAQFKRIVAECLHLGNGNVFGVPACMAAYQHGEDWLQELLVYLKNNLDFLDAQLTKRIPQVKLIYPQATYIPLLDFSALGLSDEDLKDFLITQAKVALNMGTIFGQTGSGFARINVATPKANLEEFITRLENALKKDL